MLRRSAATAALVTLALGLPARPQGAGPATLLAGPPDQEMLIESDELVYGWETQMLRLQGHVVARRGEGILRAASGTLDRARNLLTLSGGVLGVEGKDVFLADSALVDLNARSAELKGAVLYLKDRPANPDSPTSGRNTLILHGLRVRRLGGGAYAAEEVALTPCDCAGEPDYELLAHEATLDGDRAHLSGVRLRMFGAPIPLFPLSLPLTQRQSGLLAPEIGFGAPFWFTWAQPVFLTLGRSNDLTVTPGFYTGGTDHGTSPGLRSIKGPRLGLEWRYAPVAGTAGSISLDLYKDLDQGDTAAAGAPYTGERAASAGRGFGGVRGIAHFAHRTEDGPVVVAVQGAAATDVMAGRDPQPYSLDSVQDLLRTDVGAWMARGPLTVGADATLMQDLRTDAASNDRRLFGPEARSTFQRLPGLFAQLAPVPFGPATFEAEAGAVQFERLAAAGPEERLTGFGPTDRGAPGPVLPSDASRAPALRFDFAPRLRVSGPPGLPLDLRGEVGGRIDAWVMEEHSDRDRLRAYGLVGASAALPLERRFGDLLHRIEPEVAIRLLTRPLEAGGPPIGDLTDAGGATFSSAPDAAKQGLPQGVPAARRAYDEIDFAAPASGAIEVSASLSQALWRKTGGAPARFLSFDIFQDALVWAHGAKARLGQTSVGAGTQLGPASFSAGGRYDWKLHDLVALAAAAGVHDARGDEVHASLTFLRGSSSDRLRAGIDELFSAARYDITPGSLSGNLGGGASAVLPRNLRLAWEATWTPGDNQPADFANFYHRATLSLETPCKCAGFVLILGFPFHDTHLLKDRPDISIRIDLKSLGSFATF